MAGGGAVELPQGTLTMMILKALTWGPMHGYAILTRRPAFGMAH
jgi:DNA-binding PadR family transcriptional regulator